MSDLDARVAALLVFADVYKHWQSDGTRKDLEDAIRAELQKPALHEPVTDEAVERAAFEAWAKEYGRIFLDKTPFETMKGERYTCAWTQEAWVGWQARAALSKRKEAMHLHKFEALGAEEPAQEEITDAERYQYVRDNMAHIRHLNKITMSNHEFDSAVNQAIRASKGEK